jgi:hypothetical protein
MRHWILREPIRRGGTIPVARGLPTRVVTDACLKFAVLGWLVTLRECPAAKLPFRVCVHLSNSRLTAEKRAVH